MDASSTVRDFEAWRKYFRDANLPRRLLADIEQWLDEYWNYKHGFSMLARERCAKLAEAIEDGDLASASSLLFSWGVR